MKRPSQRGSPLVLFGAAALLALVAGCHFRSAAESAAADIVEKNVAARGGLGAWRAVQTLSMSGKLDAGKARDPIKLAASYLRPREAKVQARKALAHGREAEPDNVVQLPFVMELQRPLKTRLEIRFQGETAVQVFDGAHGWKLRPFLGRHEVEPYTPDEQKVAAQQTELDGPLIDHAAKGSTVVLEGTEKVEGHEAYKLKVTLGNGEVRRVWVDTQSYLDLKIDGQRKLDGKFRPMWTYFRDYRAVGGLQIPHLLETAVDGVPGSEKIIVEQVTVNPPLPATRFARPD